ncbi:MAG: hypothetical protein SCJ93_03855 [Bacillota bacterium]|nr:hypothetical protein [Bacillota bacterium]
MKKKNQKSPRMLFLVVLIIFSLMIFVTSCGSNDEDVEENNEEVETDTGEEENLEAEEENEDTNEEIDDSDDSEDGDSMTEEDISILLSDLDGPSEYYYEQTIVTGEYTSTQKFWFKGESMKIEGEQDGVPYILIWTEDSMTNLDPESKTAYRSTYVEDTEGDSIEGPAGFGDTDNFDFENDESFKYLGKETVNGEPCYVIESTFSEDNTLSKVWIHEEYGIAMRTEISGGTEAMNAVMEVRNLKIGDVSNNEFEIPEDYEIFDY